MQACVCVCVCVVFQQFSTAIKTATASPRDHKNRMSAMKNDKNIGREKSVLWYSYSSKPLEHVYMCVYVNVCYLCEYIYSHLA